MQLNNADNLPAYLNNTNTYRAYLGDNEDAWGSNTTKGHKGNMHGTMVRYGLDPANNSNYMDAALGFVNYFHGVNPTGFCYLSNMGQFGAENAINEFYHAWFEDGSTLWDRVGTSTYAPLLGYVPRGVDPTYSPDVCCPIVRAGQHALCNTPTLTPPLNQPIQKSYKERKTGRPQKSWTITEAGIYSQAAYVRLLSNFVVSPCDISTRIQPHTDDTFEYHIYPDPAADQITVVGDRRAQFYIMEPSGKLIYWHQVPAAQNRVE